MLNSFQHLTASLYLAPSLGEILKQVQDDFGRFLLFLHSFWGSQFNTYVKSHRSQLKNLSYLCNLCAIHHICQKTRKRDLGVTEENTEIFNLLIINRMQICKITSEITRKKGVQLKLQDEYEQLFSIAQIAGWISYVYIRQYTREFVPLHSQSEVQWSSAGEQLHEEQDCMKRQVCAGVSINGTPAFSYLVNP